VFRTARWRQSLLQSTRHGWRHRWRHVPAITCSQLRSASSALCRCRVTLSRWPCSRAIGYCEPSTTGAIAPAIRLVQKEHWFFCTSQATGWEDRLRNDLYSVERKVNRTVTYFLAYRQQLAGRQSRPLGPAVRRGCLLHRGLVSLRTRSRDVDGATV